MANLLDRIDRATSGLCPCGAAPAHGSAYCSDDCRPSHVGNDTDTREGGHLATPMRWRPDLVTAAADDDLIDLGTETWYDGDYRAQIFERTSRPGSWHLRLDDGHRYVGCDLADVGDRQDSVPDDLVERVRRTWRRLEQELTDPRSTVPYAVPWRAALRLAPRSPAVGTVDPAHLRGALPEPWRRLCRQCDRHGVPLDGRRAGVLCQLCEHCRTPFPGPALLPTVQSHGRHTVLKLTYVIDGEQFTRSAFVSGRDLLTAEDPSALVQTSWDRLEAFLLDQLSQPLDQLSQSPAGPLDPAAPPPNRFGELPSSG